MCMAHHSHVGQGVCGEASALGTRHWVCVCAAADGCVVSVCMHTGLDAGDLSI